MTEQQRRAAEVAKLRTEREAQLEEQVGGGWGWGSGQRRLHDLANGQAAQHARADCRCCSRFRPAPICSCLQANRKAVAAELRKLAEEEMSARIALDLKRQMEVGCIAGQVGQEGWLRCG